MWVDNGRGLVTRGWRRRFRFIDCSFGNTNPERCGDRNSENGSKRPLGSLRECEKRLRRNWRRTLIMTQVDHQ